uniref:CWF19-like protein 2 n=1 Tax=Phallusia mammillata TaxID=59560 RepID=A0A6F9DAU9_9ASCI|nr:CWF19-like protein 2 [Phallusia mammillata]
MASFVSERDINKSRNFKQREQAEVLTAAKNSYEERQQYKQYQKDSGQDKWILPSLQNRLDQEPKTHHAKRKHKEKKQKKKSKKKRKHDSTDDSSEEEMWVEAKTGKDQPKQENTDWMQQDFLAGIKTVTSQEVKEEKRAQKQKALTTKQLTLDLMGQHEKELNPYWKSGGTGLPSTDQEKPKKIPCASWLRKSLQRMEEESGQTGKSIETIAAERYGSWNSFKDMLDAAEAKEGISKAKPRERFRRPDDSDAQHSSTSREQPRKRFLKPGDDREQSGEHKNRGKQSVEKHAWRKSSCEVSKLKNASPGTKADFQKQKVGSSEQSKEETISLPSTKNVPKPNPIQTTQQAQSKNTADIKILTEQEKNAISAKIIKAELMGKADLANRLKQKLEASRLLEKQGPSRTSVTEKNSESSSEGSDSDEEVVVLTRTSKTGQSWPVTKSADDTLSKRQKKKKVKVHDPDGERERYFADDDKYSLRDLVERERSGAAEDQTQVLNRLSSKMFRGTDGENFTLDDMFVSQAGVSNTTGQEESRQEQRAIQNHKKLMRRLDKCKYCFGNSNNPKHLLVSIGRVAYLRLPSHRPLATGHCIIAPMHHCSTGTAMDEDVWSEIRKFMQSLCNFFASSGDDCVFLQTCISLKHAPHFFIECIPLPKELGDMAPIYFKKAIQECESEWAQNKKLIDTRGSNVRNKLPAGLPYFAVDFGLDGGFAHVVEDEMSFPLYFGREILGGMLDAEPTLWRKPHEEHFNEQMKRALEFEAKFKPHDWTDRKSVV